MSPDRPQTRPDSIRVEVRADAYFPRHDVVVSCAYPGQGLRTKDEGDRIEARLKSCYEACAGISDPSGLSALIQAAEDAVKYFGPISSDGDVEAQDAFDALRAALAKCRGEAK